MIAITYSFGTPLIFLTLKWFLFVFCIHMLLLVIYSGY